MAVVMDADRMARTLMRIAHEILERHRGVEGLALVGIRARGVPLAARLAAHLRELAGADVPTGALTVEATREGARGTTDVNLAPGDEALTLQITIP